MKNAGGLTNACHPHETFESIWLYCLSPRIPPSVTKRSTFSPRFPLSPVLKQLQPLFVRTVEEQDLTVSKHRFRLWIDEFHVLFL